MVSSLDSDRQIDCSRAFLLSEGDSGLTAGGGALRVDTRELLHNDFAIARGEERVSEPIEFVRAEGRTPGDLIGTTYTTLTIVSQRFIDVLREHHFMGWTTFPILVRFEDGSDLERYFGLAVTGRCGAIDDSLSEPIILPPPVPSGRARSALRGVCFCPDTWDGSDMFCAQDYAGVFVTERVKETLERAGVTNVAFRRLSEIERIWRADRSVINSD
jgi:uncharacterized protein DUF1629